MNPKVSDTPGWYFAVRNFARGDFSGAPPRRRLAIAAAVAPAPLAGASPCRHAMAGFSRWFWVKRP